MRLALLIAGTAFAVQAQTVANPDRLPERWKSFERPQKSERLECRAQAIPAHLNLTFRFQTGYRVEVPLKQYTDSSHWWSVVLRVTPESQEREPVWLVSRLRVPRVPERKAVAEFGGAYLVGEGKYRVDMLVVDDRNRYCTADWKINAKLSGSTKLVRAGLTPGTVDDISLRRSRRNRTAMGPEEEPKYKVSVLLHAAATWPGRVRLRGYDRMLLLSAVSSLIERLPLRKASFTVFNMEQQKELFHTPDLSGETFQKAVESLNGLELGTVDYATLQNPGGHVDLVSELLNRELAAQDAPDAVVFIGPLGRTSEPVPVEELPAKADAPPVYYVQLRPWRRAVGSYPDTISRTVKKIGGRTKEVYSPEDFAEAIQDVERLLARNERSRKR